jgi:DNA-directed RNA polymerase subunit RPC12/RpoP
MTTMILDNFVKTSSNKDVVYSCFRCGTEVPEHLVACWNCGQVLDENISSLVKNK